MGEMVGGALMDLPLVRRWQEMWQNERDPSLTSYPIVRSQQEYIFTILAYIAIITIGPRIMARREAFQLKTVLVIYNLGLTLLSAYMVYEMYSVIQTTSLFFGCVQIDKSHPDAPRTLSIVYLHTLSKVLEFLDTIFFVLRKKNDQLSFLHTYHHVTIFTMWWLACNFAPGGSILMGGMVNSFIHVIMYFYYFLSTMPSLRQYLWWKKYLTSMQMIQFVIIGSNSIKVGILQSCGHQSWIQFINIFYMVSLLILFGNFFVRSYRGSGKQKKT